MIQGVGASDGIAIGKVYLKRETEVKIVFREVEDTGAELERFNQAAEKCRVDLERRYNKTVNILGDDEAEVYKRHLGVFNGSILLGQVRKEITEQGSNAEYILNNVKNKYASMFDRVADDFLKKKSESIKYIAEQIIKELGEVDTDNLSEIVEPVIIVASEIDSNDVVQLDKSKVIAFVTESGGKSSYSAIIASNFEVPAVVGAKGVMNQISDGDEIIVDGQKGEIIINPDSETKDKYFKQVDREKEMQDVYKNYAERKTSTKDGHEFELAVAAGNLNDVKEARESGSESIGVMATEYVFVGRETVPDEETQFIAYRDAITKAEGLTVTFSTLNCMADNSVPYIYFHKDRNPVMGYRGIRVTLSERELFVTQLKAILRASAYGRARIVFPMIVSLDELLDAKMAVEEAKIALTEAGEFFDPDIQIGMMVETPSAAMLIDVFASDVDFFIIGTTNLIQFMNAVDRSNENLSDLFDSFNPGVLRMVYQIIRAAHSEGTWISVIGEMTRYEMLIPLLAAFGVDQICVDSENITKTRWSVSQVEKSKWERYIREGLRMPSGNEVKAYFEQKYIDDVLRSQ